MEVINKDEITEKIITKLREVIDKELPISIYDLGLIYKIEPIQKDDGIYVDIDMTLIDSRCSNVNSLIDEISIKVKTIENIKECNVHMVFSPKWEMTMITQEGLTQLRQAGQNHSHSMF